MIYLRLSRHILLARVSIVTLCLAGGCGLRHFRQRSAAELMANPNYTWITDSTTHTRIHYLAGSPAADSLVRLKRDIERAWLRAAEFVGDAAVNRVIDVFAVPNRAMVGQLAGLPIEANELNFWEQRVVIAWITPRGWAGPHEFVHIMAHDSWGTVTEWWLGEGAAVAAGPWAGADVDAYTKCLKATGKALPLSMIVPGMRNPDARTQRVAYPEAGSFVRFLIERYGRDKVARVYSTGASAVPAIYGRSLAELEQEWQRHLETIDSGTTSCDVP